MIMYLCAEQRVNARFECIVASFMYSFRVLLYTELSATFEESTASVVESELSVEACIILSNSALERDIVITVTSEQDTATGTLYIRVIHNYYG